MLRIPIWAGPIQADWFKLFQLRAENTNRISYLYLILIFYFI